MLARNSPRRVAEASVSLPLYCLAMLQLIPDE
jgi:hypothetical protein